MLSLAVSTCACTYQEDPLSCCNGDHLRLPLCLHIDHSLTHISLTLSYPNLQGMSRIWFLSFCVLIRNAGDQTQGHVHGRQTLILPLSYTSHPPLQISYVRRATIANCFYIVLGPIANICAGVFLI